MSGAVLSAELLAGWRQLLGMSQTHLGEELGVNQATLSRWEQGTMQIGAAGAIRRALHDIERERAEQGHIPLPPSAHRAVEDHGPETVTTEIRCPSCQMMTEHTMLTAVMGEPCSYARWACMVCGEQRYTRWAFGEEAEEAGIGSVLPALPTQGRGRYPRNRPTDLRRKERRSFLQGRLGGKPRI